MSQHSSWLVEISRRMHVSDSLQMHRESRGSQLALLALSVDPSHIVLCSFSPPPSDAFLVAIKKSVIPLSELLDDSPAKIEMVWRELMYSGGGYCHTSISQRRQPRRLSFWWDFCYIVWFWVVSSFAWDTLFFLSLISTYLMVSVSNIFSPFSSCCQCHFPAFHGFFDKFYDFIGRHV